MRTLLSAPTANRELHLIIPSMTATRLLTTCFRGKDKQLAGNFFHWDDIVPLMKDKLILEEMLKYANEILLERAPGETIDQSFTVTYPQLVGWDSTDRIEDYRWPELEQFQPNKRSTGMRVRRETGKLAKLTNQITIIMTVGDDHRRSNSDAIIIRSIYPGVDLGELIGNVSQRERRVFFDWDHPGEPLPQTHH